MLLRLWWLIKIMVYRRILNVCLADLILRSHVHLILILAKCSKHTLGLRLLVCRNLVSIRHLSVIVVSKFGLGLVNDHLGVRRSRPGNLRTLWLK